MIRLVSTKNEQTRVKTRAGFYTGAKTRAGYYPGVKSRAGFRTGVKTRAGFYPSLFIFGGDQSNHYDICFPLEYTIMMS